tara:strand:+ start:514 stop:1377 length:864 start_codon:yes stop_codon:yes gene_type:complete
MSTIKVDTIATRTGSGNITLSNNVASLTSAGAISGTNLTASGTLGVTGAITGTTQTLNRSGNGVIQTFQKDGSTIGQISGTIGLIVGNGDTGLGFQTSSGDAIIPQRPDTQAGADNLLSFGNTSYRFKDMYLGGGLYVGGTGAANKLDDYEEGTAFAGIQDDSGNAYSFYEQNGQYNTLVYTKIGRLVFFTIRFYTSSTGSAVGSQHARITGLPFTSRGSGPIGFSIIHNSILAMNTSSALAFSGDLNPNNTIIKLYKQDTDGDYSAMTITELGAFRGDISGMYHTA